MKKLCTAAFLLLANVSYALPVDNPAIPRLFFEEIDCDIDCDADTDIDCVEDDAFCDFLSFSVGFYGDYVFNRHMETIHDRDIDTTRIFTNAAFLAVNFYERFDVFATLGGSRISLNTSLVAFNPTDPHPLFEIETDTAFSYSIGARTTLWQFGCVSFGVEGQYFATEPRIKRMYIAAGAVSYPDDVLKTRYSEWQVGAAVSYRYNEFFIPYAAIKYAHAFWKLNNGQRFIIDTNTGTFLFNMRNQKNVGYAVGLTLCPLSSEKLIVTVEARFADEKALYCNGQMRF